MSEPAVAGTFCARHPDVAATWVCGRCGSFMCQGCERRTRPEAKPLCPGCAELRAQRVEPVKAASKTALQTTGFVLGIIGLLPIPAVTITAIVVNIIALVKAKEPPASLTRWKSVVGLGLSSLGLMFWVVLLVIGLVAG